MVLLAKYVNSFFAMRHRNDKCVKRNIIFLLIACVTCTIFLCACRKTDTPKSTLQVFAETSLEKTLPLVGDKYLVTDGKGSDIAFCFLPASELMEKLHANESCDVMITTSETIPSQLEKEGIISEGKTIRLLESPMALFTSAESPFTSSLENLFYQPEGNEEEDDEDEDEDTEEYLSYLDVLREVADEEQWQEEWEDLYADLWIRADYPSIGILSLQETEGQVAKEVLNQNNEAYDLLDQIGEIHFYPSDAELIEAVRNGEVQLGICAVTSAFGEKNLQTLQVYDKDTDPVLSYYVFPIAGAENKEAAKGLIQFLQKDHAKRFFEDFGFYFMR